MKVITDEELHAKINNFLLRKSLKYPDVLTNYRLDLHRGEKGSGYKPILVR